MTDKERAKELGVPVIPPLKPFIREQPYDPNPVVAICGECHREVRQIEGYQCGNSRCPMQSKITC